MSTAYRQGQILILVLLIVVVALAVGLSVASRNITNLRTSTQTERSQKAFTAAEGGVEHVLSQLTSIVSANSSAVNSPNGYTLPPGSIPLSTDTTVNIKGNSSYEALVEEGLVGQVMLEGASLPQNLHIEWVKTSDTVESGNLASLEITFVCTPNPPTNTCLGDSTSVSASGYSQHRLAYSFLSHGSDEQGFTQCPGSGTGLSCSVTIPLPVTATNLKFVRVRPFWNKATVRVYGDGTIPIQTYKITSTATTDLGITRKVEVTRTALPQLPAAFDYVLLAEQGDISK